MLDKVMLGLKPSLLRNISQMGAGMREVVQEAEWSGIGGGSAEYKDAPALCDVATVCRFFIVCL